MKEYFLAVIFTAMLGGIATELLPDSSGMRSYVRAVTGFCVLAALILPMKAPIEGLGDLLRSISIDGILSSEGEEAYESVFENALDHYVTEDAEAALAHLLENAFFLQAGTCEVRLTMQEGEVVRVLVLLSGRSMLEDPRPIAAYVEERLSCPCDVAVGN